VLNSPKQSILKLIKRFTEEDGGIGLRSSNAFWWHPALSPLAMYHAMLARAHRLQTRCREARLRSAAAPKISTACPLCKAQVDDEDHAVGGTCTGENVINLIRMRHDHAVKSIWSAVRAGDLGGFPMWTDVETRSKTAIARDGARTRRLPVFLLPHVYQYVLGRVSPQNSRSAVGSTHVKSFLDTTRLSSISGAPKRAPYAINRCGVADPATGATL